METALVLSYDAYDAYDAPSGVTEVGGAYKLIGRLPVPALGLHLPDVSNMKMRVMELG